MDGNLEHLNDTRGTDDAKQEFAYDGLNKLTNVKYYDTDDTTVLEEYTIQYAEDQNNNHIEDQIAEETITTRYGGTPVTTTKSYVYDNLGRLTSDTIGSTTNSYTYDAVGNRLSRTCGTDVLYYDYNSDDQLTKTATDDDFEAADIVTSYGYDLSGNQTSKTEGTSVTSYSYDDANRLNSVTLTMGGGTPLNLGTYEYDAAGQRTKKDICDGYNGLLLQRIRSALYKRWKWGYNRGKMFLKTTAA